MMIKGVARTAVLLLLCLCLIPADQAPAQDALQTDDEAEFGEGEKAVGNGFDVRLYIQGGYIVNGGASSPDLGRNSENELRLFDHKANSFTLDLAQMLFAREATADRIGFHLKLSAGETAQWIHARGLSGAPLNSPQRGDATDEFDLTEAYLRYIAPVGAGLRVDAGKKATFFGAEVIEAKDNANYSRSLLFNYAIPRTHTGVTVGYDLPMAIVAGIHLVNGWDNASDNNTGKSVGFSVGYTPASFLTATLNYLTGPEQDGITGHKRALVDIVATIRPTERLTCTINYDNGKENGVFPGVNAGWSGVSLVVRHAFNERYSLSGRAEYFNDKDGARITSGVPQRVSELTVTPELRLVDGFVLRPEYRHDMSSKPSFDDNTKKVQDTIALGVMYTW